MSSVRSFTVSRYRNMAVCIEYEVLPVLVLPEVQNEPRQDHSQYLKLYMGNLFTRWKKDIRRPHFSSLKRSQLSNGNSVYRLSQFE